MRNPDFFWRSGERNVWIRLIKQKSRLMLLHHYMLHSLIIGTILELSTRFFVNIWTTIKLKNVQMWVFSGIRFCPSEDLKEPHPPAKKRGKKVAKLLYTIKCYVMVGFNYPPWLGPKHMDHMRHHSQS